MIKVEKICMSVLRYAVLGVGVVLISGCDFMGGVYLRSQPLESLPDLACVRETIAQVPGVTNVRYAHDIYEIFDYDTEGVTVHIELRKEAFSNDVTFLHAYHNLNYIPPRDLALRVRNVMIRVDEALEAKCGMKNLTRDMHEGCVVEPPFAHSKCP